MSKSKPSGDTNPILEDQLGLGGSEAEGQVTNPLDSVTPTADPTPDSLADEPKSTVGELPGVQTDKPARTDLRPWYKRPKLWGKLALGAGAVIVLGLGATAWYTRTQNHQFISQNWLTVTQAADRADTESAKASYDNFDPAYQALADLDNKLSQILTQKPSSWLGDGAALSAFNDALTSLKTYTDKAKDQANRLSDINDSDLTSLKSSATATKIIVEDNRAKFSFASGDIPGDFYLLNERFDRVITAHKDAENEQKAKTDAAVSKEEQAKQDKADAEESASRWTQAYIAGSVADMKKYMTAAFAKEYDFSQVTASYRATNYPTSYRRVSTDLKADQYEIVETVTFVTKSDYTADTNYTTTYVFLISQDSSSKKWLVNSQRYQ